MSLSAPFLKRLTLLPEKAEPGNFPFNRLEFLKGRDFQIDFTRPITFFVGENGTGKSTLLEAIAEQCGFHQEGGSSDHQLYGVQGEGEGGLSAALRPSWLPKVRQGFFFRSESFFNLASYIDEVGDIQNYYGGRRMHAQSHGEAFLSLFTNRFGSATRAIYLMDEPETALSPQRQFAFLRIMREWELSGNVQAIIATHSPILMSYPGAQLLSFDGGRIKETTFTETEHYRMMKAFLADPKRYLDELFAEEE